jgi:hypothetical protein
MRAFALDWSGKAKNSGEFIWLAEAVDGQLVELENGRDRAAVVDEVIRRSASGGDVAVGLDFAFSFPRWWCERNGWPTSRAMWGAADKLGDDWLAACDAPFWGRPGVTNPNTPEEDTGAPTARCRSARRSRCSRLVALVRSGRDRSAACRIY